MAEFKGEIHQSIFFDAPPSEVYRMLTDAEILSDFTGSPATMEVVVGGTFELFDGYCTGTTLQCVPNERLVQSWNFVEEGWPSDHYSICTFVFKAEGTGTALDFEQTEIPEHKFAALDAGWSQYFWDPMKELLANG